MYEARQRKEKISRRIESEGQVRRILGKNMYNKRTPLQMVTVTSYNIPNVRHGNSNIVSILHFREIMTNAQKSLAKRNSGYISIQPNAYQNCNHCVPYAMVANTIKSRLVNNSIYDANNYLQDITATISKS